MYLDDILGDRNVRLSCETPRWLSHDAGWLSFLLISPVREFHKGEFFLEGRTSKAMVMGITVHLGECPSGDVKGVGCEHGTHCRLYSIAIFSCQLKSSLRRRWSALVVGGDQGPTMRRSRIRSFSSLHNATFKPHCHIDYSGLFFIIFLPFYI